MPSIPARGNVAEAGAMREAMERLGVAAGHRVALLVGNTRAAVAAHACAAAAGWTLVPFAPTTPANALAQGLAQTNCDAAIVDHRHAGPLRDTMFRGPVLATDAALRDLSFAPGTLAPPKPEPGPAYLVATSGTGGVPRRVAITGGMLEAHAAAASSRLAEPRDAVWLGVLPLHRIGGIALLDRRARDGLPLLLHEAFDAEAVAQALRQGVTHASLVPAMLRRLLAAWGPSPPPPSLQSLLVGGDHAPEGLVQPALAKGWPVWCTYGMTETCSQAATATPAQRLERPGTSGRPLDAVGIEVVEGEVVVSGPTVAGGTHRTGDLGRIDAEGFVYVTGRKDDRITTGGAKVDPAVVEDALRRHPAVADACVVGLPDEAWGARVVAAVVVAGAMPDLRAWCKARLAPEEVPKEFVPLAALPRTDLGKLRRADVRASLQATVPT